MHRPKAALLVVVALVLASAGLEPAAAATTLGWIVVPVQAQHPRVTLADVDGVAGNDVWVVGGSQGGHAIALHWDGGSWTDVPTPRPPGNGRGEFLAVSALAANDVWAVGVASGNIPLTEHWDGTSWSVLPAPAPDAGGDTLRSVAAIGPADAWAAGTSNTAPTRPLLLHWDGVAWTSAGAIDPDPTRDADLVGVAGTPGDVWAVGSYKDAKNGIRTLAERWNGHVLRIVKTPNVPHSGSWFTDVAAVAPGDVWAVGGGNATGLSEHWDGSAWSIVPMAPTHLIVQIDSVDVASDGTVITGGWLGASDQSALIERWRGGGWTMDAAANVKAIGQELSGVLALSSSDAWGVGNALTSRWNPLAEHYTIGSFTSKLGLSAAPNPVVVGHPLTLTGTLTLSNRAVPDGAVVHVQRRNPDGTTTPLPDQVVDDGGTFTLSETLPGLGTYSYVGTFDGDATFSGDVAKRTVIVQKIPSSITVRATPASVLPGGTTTLSGTLTLSDGASAAGRVVHLSDTPPGGSPTELGTTTTTSTGGYSFATPPLSTKGVHTFAAHWDGDSLHAAGDGSAAARVLAARITFSGDAAGSDDIYTMYDDGTGSTRLTGPTPDDFDPSWSPDGTRIAFTSDMDAGDDVWIMNADGSNPQRFTPTGGFDGLPDWSPDGTRIAYSSEQTGNLDVWVKNVSGGSATQITTNAHDDSFPAWSPDGSSIVFGSERSGASDLYVKNLTTGVTTQLTDDPAYDYEPAWSPDGSTIAFASDRGGSFDVWLLDVSSGATTQLTNSTAYDAEPAWSADGATILFDSTRTGSSQIYRVSPDGSGLLQITTGSADHRHPDWHELG